MLFRSLGVTTLGTADALVDALSDAGLPTLPPPGTSADAVSLAIRHDKKSRRGTPRVTLLRAIGEAARFGPGWSFPLEDATLRAALRDATGGSGAV